MTLSIRQQDNSQISSIFTPVKLSCFDNSLIETQIQISKNRMPGTLYVYNTYLFIRVSCFSYRVQIDLNLGFVIDFTNLQITFHLGQKQEQITETISFRNEDNLNDTFYHLKKMLPQLNFHSKYQVLQKLGQGQNATVSKIKRKEDGKLFAAKMTRNFTNLSQEISIISMLDHPNLIHFQEFYVEQDQGFIIMDYEDGGNLYEIMAKNNFCLNFKQRLKIYQDVLNGLQFLRIKGIVHRDIKPENIIYSQTDGNFKIADFGLAIQNGKSVRNIVGTPGYLSPQLFDNKQQRITNIKSDIYSAGLVFYQLISGQLYYKGTDKQDILEANKKGKKFKTVKNAKITQNEKKMLSYMIQKDLVNRKNSCQILANPIISKLLESARSQKQSTTDSTNETKKEDKLSQENIFFNAVKKIMPFRSSSK